MTLNSLDTGDLMTAIVFTWSDQRSCDISYVHGLMYYAVATFSSLLIRDGAVLCMSHWDLGFEKVLTSECLELTSLMTSSYASFEKCGCRCSS